MKKEFADLKGSGRLLEIKIIKNEFFIINLKF
jgi:hypothetical protein